MARNWRRLWHLSIISIILSGASVNLLSPLRAQIIPDNSLRSENSVVTPLNGQVDRIDGGLRRGSNLFHSFQEFNIREGQGAYFANPAVIENIFSRVTGSNASRLFGTLGVLGNANLFFINPNGIIFGPNARLDLRGSFVGSTASSIAFSDGIEFSATNPEAPPLLTVNVKPPIGLRFEGNPGTIINQSRATDNSGQIVGVQVEPGQTIGLIGGEIDLAGGVIKAPGGRIELGAVATGSEVSLNSANNDFSLGYEEVENFGDIQLSQQAVANTSGEGGGFIHVQGRNVHFTQGSGLVADTLGSIDGGGINISAEQFRLEDESFVSAFTFGAGKGGDVTILASKEVELIGTGFENFQQIFVVGALTGNLSPSALRNGIFTGTASIGRAGDIIISTPSLLLKEGASVLTFTSPLSEGKGGNVVVTASESVEIIGSGVNTITLGSGIAGDLTIDTKKLIVRDGAIVSTATLGEGAGGNLTVKASDSVEITSTPAGIIIPTIIVSNSIGGMGNAGNITIDTQQLMVKDGAQISAGSGSSIPLISVGGQGGNLTVKSTELVEISGISADGKFQSIVSAGTLTPSAAGNILIETGKLIVQNGGVILANSGNSFTRGDVDKGPAGNLTIKATESVEINTTTPFPRSGVSSRTESKSDGGNIVIETGKLIVQNSGVLTRTLSSGNAGDLIVIANEVELIGKRPNFAPSGLLANAESSASGNGGELSIKTERLLIRDGGAVSVVADGTGTAGNIRIETSSLTLDNGNISAQTASKTGGNIQLQVQDLLLLRRGSQISSTAGTAEAGGDGGDLTIEPNFLVAFPSENNDITANAFTGKGGSISITANGIFGIEPRIRLTPLSDITASSQFGVDGIVEINTLEIDPNRGLTNLPEEAIEVEVAKGCQAGEEQAAVEFFDIGRGGLPPSPDDPLSSETIIAPWIPLMSEREEDLEAEEERDSTALEMNIRAWLRIPCQRN
ncbi:MAG: S-layer family protein [Moorea sp. SIO2B7]|nr:S-layer family protein [Moorena sp. SIO2B7]